MELVFAMLPLGGRAAPIEISRLSTDAGGRS